MSATATRRADHRPGVGAPVPVATASTLRHPGGGRHRAARRGGDVPLVTSAHVPDHACRHGKMVGVLRWITAGESHGPALVALLEGMVAGVEVTSDDVSAQLARRRLGYGRGARMKFEADKVTLVGGVRHGRTMGGPVAIEVANSEWPKWTEVMSADPVDADALAGMARNAPLTRPRPGHADYSGMLKYDFDDARPVLERASARETAARVATVPAATSCVRPSASR